MKEEPKSQEEPMEIAEQQQEATGKETEQVEDAEEKKPTVMSVQSVIPNVKATVLNTGGEEVREARMRGRGAHKGLDSPPALQTHCVLKRPGLLC